MYLCYIDESGTPDIPGTTSHYILAGLAIPIEKWRACEADINKLKLKYDLFDKEIHTGWLIRPYAEQSHIPNFQNLGYTQRRQEVQKVRNTNLLQLQKNSQKRAKYKQIKKTYNHTEAYIHLTRHEREAFVEEIAKVIGSWIFARLFAECIDKIHYGAKIQSADEQAFEQLVSRFERFLVTTAGDDKANNGILIHDNNQTVAKRHTDLMKKFHRNGTFWTQVKNIIETPLFVDSTLTSMIQIADLCSYALRRFCENNETKLFNHIYKRADRKNGVIVGIRHFTGAACTCRICLNHKTPITPSLFGADVQQP